MNMMDLLLLSLIHLGVKSKWFDLDVRALFFFIPVTIATYAHIVHLYLNEGGEEVLAFLFFVVVVSTWATLIQRRMTHDIRSSRKPGDDQEGE